MPCAILLHTQEFLKSHLKKGDKAEPDTNATAAATGTTRHLPPTLPEKERITDDDFYNRSQEYRTWLQEDRKKMFWGG